jgi:hypothetical protein
MTDDAQIEKIIDFCFDEWQKAKRPEQPDRWATPEIQNGQQTAYLNVIRFARRLLEG